MEFCGSGSLRDYLDTGNHLDEATIRDMMACCLYGLSYLHGMRIIHRVRVYITG